MDRIEPIPGMSGPAYTEEQLAEFRQAAANLAAATESGDAVALTAALLEGIRTCEAVGDHLTAARLKTRLGRLNSRGPR